MDEDDQFERHNQERLRRSVVMRPAGRRYCLDQLRATSEHSN